MSIISGRLQARETAVPLGRPLVPLTLTDEQQDQLNGIARSATLPHALVQRAGMILASAEARPTLRSPSASASHHKPSASGDGASEQPVSRACTTNSDRSAPDL